MFWSITEKSGDFSFSLYFAKGLRLVKHEDICYAGWLVGSLGNWLIKIAYKSCWILLADREKNCK